MKAYCINLDRRPDRLDHMAGQFSLQGIAFERVSALDAQRPDIAALAATCPPTSLGPRMSAGAYACFLSHREAWHRLVASGDGHAMVLEDDLLLAGGIAAYLQDGWVPPDADLIRLETCGTRLHVSGGAGHQAGARELRRLRSSHLGTGCYVISAGAARMLLEKTHIFSEPIDMFLFDAQSQLFKSLVTYQMVPAPAVQGKRPVSGGASMSWSESSITERFAAGVEIKKPKPAESSLERIFRRAKEELRAGVMQTHYIVVPHG